MYIMLGKLWYAHKFLILSESDACNEQNIIRMKLIGRSTIELWVLTTRHMPVKGWHVPGFLKIIAFVWKSLCVHMYVSMLVCVCLSVPKAIITNGMIWTPYGWLNKLYNFYVATVVSTIRKCGLSIDVHREN